MYVVVCARKARQRGGWCRRVATAMLACLALLLVLSAGASGSASRVQRLCGNPRPGAAACMAMKLVRRSLTGADLRANARRQAARRADGLRADVEQPKPIAGHLTPQLLHEAYALPTETVPAATQTIALIDAFDDPSAEADLAVFDQQFGLPACTSANGCFRKVNEQGQASPLPALEGEWTGEISIDVQMAHAICESCHILLVEADSEEFSDLGASVNTAVNAGATVVSNSYGAPEEADDASLGASDYDHPGVVITAATGDCGYLNKACKGDGQAANFPADSADVVAVGGTSLTESGNLWSSTAWKDGGSGCSSVFSAAPWQSGLSEFAATGCASGRGVADVAAIGDPNTGVDVYNSTPEGNGDPTGWGVWGGTSVTAPIIAGEYALAGGAQEGEEAASSLYGYIGDAAALYDVTSGTNGSCSKTTACQAAVGYDGPTGVGSPLGLSAFVGTGAPVNSAPPTVAGVAQEGQTLTVTEGEWTNSPTSIAEQWERCNASGARCSAIPAAGGAEYTLKAADVGSTIRVAETASNSSGSSSPSLSAHTALVSSDVPALSGFSPASGITGSTLKISGSALALASEVRFGSLAASFTVLSDSSIEAVVPNGAKTGKITVIAPGGTGSSTAKFKVSFALSAFSPASGSVGRKVTIKGVGFAAGASVSFGGVPASNVTRISSKKLTAIVPAGALSAPITVTNTGAPAGTVSSAGVFTVN
jgi:hypothetical protein